MTDPVDPETGVLSLDPVPRAATTSGFSRDLLRAVADLVLKTTYEGVWLIDTEARTSFINDRMAQMMGYTVDEMIGLPVFRYMDDDGRKAMATNIERRRNGVEEQHEFKCIRKDGTPIWLLVTANPVYNRTGGYAGSLAMVADLSIQKAREQALVAEREDLNRRLAELTASHSSLQAIANRDALTGLYNRRYFDDRIAQETDRCRRHTRRLCLLFLDIDGFKGINERFGHSLADEVLRGIGQALTDPSLGNGHPLLRSSDVAARYGGDEIVVLAPETDLEGGFTLARRILDRWPTIAAPLVDGKRVMPSVSVGVAACPYHAATPGDLIAAADRAMFRAKGGGGGRACLAEPPAP